MLEDLLQRRPYNAVTDLIDTPVERGLAGKTAFIDADRTLSAKSRRTFAGEWTFTGDKYLPVYFWRARRSRSRPAAARDNICRRRRGSR